MENMKIPLIIGLQTIGENLLLYKLTDLCGHCTPTVRSTPQELVCACREEMPCRGCYERAFPKTEQFSNIENHPGGSKTEIEQSARAQAPAVPKPVGVPCVDCELCTLQVRSDQIFGRAEVDEDDFEDDSPTLAEMLPGQFFARHEGGTGDAEADIEEDKDCYKKFPLEGSERMRKRAWELNEKYKHIFSERVQPEPARVPPMALEIDVDVLRGSRPHRTFPRPQTEEKAKALRDILNDLLRWGLIRVSKEATGAQVLLVAKKGTSKLRFCVDYRAINAATIPAEGWPIPDIKALIQRLGAKRAKFFAKFDLTSGFYQCPLRESDRKWTSFITAWGMFEWLRCPMGLEGVPSYFQRMMVTHVLGDIMYDIVECYLDDVITWGSTEDEFFENVEKFYIRCAKVGIKLNPLKCVLGVSEIEYLGHTINETSCHFIRSKLDRVVAFPKPTTSGELKQFAFGTLQFFPRTCSWLISVGSAAQRHVATIYKKGASKVSPMDSRKRFGFQCNCQSYR